MQTTNERNIAILSNSLAGVGKATILSRRINDELSKRDISHTLFEENWPPEFNSFTDVWIGGGDGTLNYFINHYPEIKLPLVVFNGGTGNDFHWLLYGKMSLEEQLHVALRNKPLPVDVGKCNGRYFLNDVGIGFEGEVSRSLAGKKKRAGKTSFMIMVLKKIFSYRSKNYRISIDDRLFDLKKFLIVDINNGSRAGGGFHIAPEARADDGLLDVILINAMRPLERLRWLPVIEKGKHLSRPFIHYSRAQKVIIESDELIQSHLDGEFYIAEKIEIEIIPGKLLFRY